MSAEDTEWLFKVWILKPFLDVYLKSQTSQQNQLVYLIASSNDWFSFKFIAGLSLTLFILSICFLKIFSEVISFSFVSTFMGIWTFDTTLFSVQDQGF